jgi:hypothetical protein
MVAERCMDRPTGTPLASQRAVGSSWCPRASGCLPCLGRLSASEHPASNVQWASGVRTSVFLERVGTADSYTAKRRARVAWSPPCPRTARSSTRARTWSSGRRRPCWAAEASAGTGPCLERRAGSGPDSTAWPPGTRRLSARITRGMGAVRGGRSPTCGMAARRSPRAGLPAEPTIPGRTRAATMTGTRCDGLDPGSPAPAAPRPRRRGRRTAPPRPKRAVTGTGL